MTLQVHDNRFESSIPGPPVGENGSQRTLSLPLKGQVDFTRKTVTLKTGSVHLELVEGEYSPWVQLEFKAGFRNRISGIRPGR